MKWLTIGLKLLPYIVTAVSSIERFFTSGKGKAKEDAAVATVSGILEIVEKGAGKSLIDNEQIQEAVRCVMRAIVSLQNIIQDVRREDSDEA
jgi:ribosomal protein S12 methylthiotransferase accessory factor YcaO